MSAGDGSREVAGITLAMGVSQGDADIVCGSSGIVYRACTRADNGDHIGDRDKVCVFFK